MTVVDTENPSSTLSFYRERLAAVSDAMAGWPRCKRAVCRRAGTCKGTDDFLPLCMPVVMAALNVCISECGSAIPGMPQRPPSEEPTLNQRMGGLMQRSMGILEHHIETMEKRVEKKGKWS